MYSQDAGNSLDNFLDVLSSLSGYNSANSGKDVFAVTPLVRKAVEIYPKSASRIGYETKDVSIDKESLLTHFREASIYARIYGKCYLVLHDGDMLKPLINGLEITQASYKIELRPMGDYYLDSTNTRYSHKSRTFFFYGFKAYQDPETADPDLEYVSVVKVCRDAIDIYETSIRYIQKILSNLSNIAIGIRDLGTQLRNDKGKRNLLQRLSLFDMNRRLDKAISYDLDHEKIDYISQTLSNVDVVLEEFKDYFSACVDVPRDKIFNQQKSTNLASGYQNSIVYRFEWAIKVKEWSENHYLPNLKTLYRTLGLSDEITIPIVIELSEIERAELMKIASERDKNLTETKIIAPTEIRECFKNGGYKIDIVTNEKLYREYFESDSGDAPESNQNQVQTQLEPDLETSEDSLTKDSLGFSDEFWDTLSTVSFTDLDSISEEMINE